MGKRGIVTDYAGEELRPGDLICYGARQANRIRVTDAIVLVVTTRREGGRVVPKLKVRPTGAESGFTARKRIRPQWVYTEHVRLIRAGAEDPSKFTEME